MRIGPVVMLLGLEIPTETFPEVGRQWEKWGAGGRDSFLGVK